MHLTFELYLMALRGELPPAALVEVAHRHMLELCSCCDDEWQIYARDRRRQLPVKANQSSRDRQEPSGSQHRSIFAPAGNKKEQRFQEVQRERRKARQDLSALLNTPTEQWVSKVENAQTRFRSRAFAELLLLEARDRVRSTPALARQLAELVQVVLHWLPGSHDQSWRHGLELCAQAHVANAARVAGDLAEADRIFGAIRKELHSEPIADVELHAELASLEASLRNDQRRLDEAAQALDRAIVAYNLARSEEGLARVLTQRGSLFQSLNQPAEALDLLERAADLIDPEDSPFLHLCTVTSRVLCLCDLDRADEAWDLLHRHLPSYEESDDPWVRVSVQDLRGRVLLGMGCHDEAAEAFAACRDGALELGRDYDAALASLDLALVYLEQGRTAELQELAAELVPTFQARGVGRETLAALRLFQQAVAAEELTRSVLAEVRESLRGTALNPV